MTRTSIAGGLAALAFVASTAVALAATQEFNFTVPVSVKGLRSPDEGITVSCAVGYDQLSYSTASGEASGATGKGSTHVMLHVGKGEAQQDVKVVVTDPGGNDPHTGLPTGKSPSQYLCWGKLDKGDTPVNFISGQLIKV